MPDATYRASSPENLPVQPPDRADAEPPLVAALVYDGLCTFEFAIAAEVFALPRPELGAPLYRFAAVAVDGGPMRAAGGLEVRATATLECLGRAHTIVVPGWRGREAPVPRQLLEALLAAHDRGARLLSICSGAFLLARAGLLQGRRATTHWRYLQDLQTLDTSIAVETQALYVAADRVLTSAGSAAGLDLCLHVVREDYGAAVANSVARRLVLPAHRQGSQTQFVPAPMGREAGPIAPLLDAVRRDPARPWGVADLARAARLSRRTLLRRFREATGTSPGRWVLEQRLQRARDLLETTAAPVELVAERSGLGSAESLRHHFRRAFGVAPSAYRRAFQHRRPELQSVPGDVAAAAEAPAAAGAPPSSAPGA